MTVSLGNVDVYVSKDVLMENYEKSRERLLRIIDKGGSYTTQMDAIRLLAELDVIYTKGRRNEQ